MKEVVKIYKQILKQERKYKTAGDNEKSRIMKKTLSLKKQLDYLLGSKYKPTKV